MIPSRARLGAALGVSALLHGAVLLLLRAPSPPPAGEVQMNVLIVPLERPVPPALPAAAGVTPKPVRQAEPGARQRSESPVRPTLADPETPRRRPSVSAGPVSAPRERPSSSLAAAASYVDAETLPSYPRLAQPLTAQYPRQAFEQRRKAVVVVQVMVDEDGRVAEALVLPGASEDFAAAALEALRAARFAPGRTGSGKAVRARAYFEVSFVIE